MGQRIDAIFENGVFRPVAAVNIASGERVLIDVQARSVPTDDLSDVQDLLDAEYTESCRKRSGYAPSLEQVRQTLSAFKGSLADRIAQERDER
jgi:predicted DNA-binding antitoxin AbrB/MazE fold protein